MKRKIKLIGNNSHQVLVSSREARRAKARADKKATK